MENGWSVKRLIQTIMTSSVYRQALRQPNGATGETVDPQNLLLWRMNLKRLEAETIRDAILAASGKIGPESGRDAGVAGVRCVGTADCGG